MISYKNIRIKNDKSFIVEYNGLDFHVAPDHPPKHLYGKELTYSALSDYAKRYHSKRSQYSEEATTGFELSDNEKLQTQITKIKKNILLARKYIDAGINIEKYKKTRIEL